MDNFKNSYIVVEKELVSLSVSNVGHEKCHPGYQWGPGVRDHYLIHYVAKGKGRYEVNGQWVELSAGDCFLVYPKSIVTYQADEKDPGNMPGLASREVMQNSFCRLLIFHRKVLI